MRGGIPKDGGYRDELIGCFGEGLGIGQPVIEQGINTLGVGVVAAKEDTVGVVGRGVQGDAADLAGGGCRGAVRTGHSDTVTVWSADEILVAPLGQTVPSHQIPLKEHVPSHVQQTVFPDIL